MLIIRRFNGLLSYIASLPVLQFCLAILIGSLVNWVIAVLIGGLCWAGAVLLLRGKEGISRFGRWKYFAAGLFVIGVRLSFISDVLPEGHVSKWNGKEVTVKAVVTSDINMKSEKCSLVVDVVELCTYGESEECVLASGKVQTWIPRFPRVRVGEIVVLSGRLDEPEDFEDEDEDEAGDESGSGGKSVSGDKSKDEDGSKSGGNSKSRDKFSYESYLAGKGILSLMYRPVVSYTDEREVFFLYRWLVDFSGILMDKINRLLPEPHAALLAGILLGARRNMPDDFALALQKTGTTHVIAASGYNVTLVINAVVAAFSFLHRKLRIIVSIAFVWCFVVLSGGSLPVVRAGIMGSFALIALFSGNVSTIHIMLPLGGALMVLVDPAVIFSISFQLSFVSTAGLIYIVSVLQQIFPWVPESLQESTLVTVSAILVTSPITAFNFGQFSVIAPAANFLILPVVELTMFLGMILIIIPEFLWVTPNIAASIVWVPLEYFVKVVMWLSELPFASVELPDIPGWSVVVFYAVIFVCILLKYPVDGQQSLFEDLSI